MRNLKIFLIILALSLPFWWGINIFQKKLEDFLFWKKMADNPQLLTAQLMSEERLEKLKPLKKKGIEEIKEPEISAQAAISVFLDNNGSEKILFEKNSQKILPIASLTKLMTAIVALEYYKIDQEKIKDLFLSLLITSNNWAAEELAKGIDKKTFVELMNSKAKRLEMNNTYFGNPTGLDPKEQNSPPNYSTTKDLVTLAKYITLEKPLIWEISVIPNYKNATSTNKLLNEIPEVLGGKTGETSLAGKCLLLVVKSPKNKGYIINVILNSDNHFEEMKKLVDWTKYAYRW